MLQNQFDSKETQNFQQTTLVNTPKKKRKKSPGFTLIEVIAVMAIIGVMAAALMPSVESAMNKSKDTQLVSNLSLLDSGAKIYTIENGKAPTSLQELVDKKYVPDKNYDGITYSAGTEGGSASFTGTLSSGEKVSSTDLGLRTPSGNSL